MDAFRFDQFVRTFSAQGSRRGLLGLLLGLLLSSPLMPLPRETAEARGRRKRRKTRHKRAKRQRKARRQRLQRRRRRSDGKCKSRPLAVTCAGKCGVVRNNCRKRVNCSCPECQLCDASGACQPDPATVGDPCGEPDQVCQSDGTCACQAGKCGGVCGCDPGFLCDNGDCLPCDVVFDGNSVTSGEALQTRLTSGGTVRVCPGRYQHNFVLSANVVLIGAGDGENEATSTILDANDSGRTLEVNDGVIAELQGVRITGGNSNLGGGVFSNGGLTMRSCTVSGNHASSLGGGFYLSFAGTGALALIDCRVTENSAGNHGGGFHNNSIFTTTLNDCTVTENQSVNDGGGIYNNGGVFEITGCEISENAAEGNGGGVYNATPVVSNPGNVTFDAESSVTNNTAGADGTGTGGGIFNEGTVTLNGAAVTGNEPNNCAGDPIAGCIEED